MPLSRSVSGSAGMNSPSGRQHTGQLSVLFPIAICSFLRGLSPPAGQNAKGFPDILFRFVPPSGEPIMAARSLRRAYDTPTTIASADAAYDVFFPGWR